MDPLSISVAALSILQISGKIIQCCYNYRNDVKNARKDASKIIDEVRSLQQVVESLEEVLSEEEPNYDFPLSKKLTMTRMLLDPDGPMRLIEKELNALLEKLQPSKSRWESIKQDLKWPLEKKDTQNTVEIIAKMKATINLALSTDQRILTQALRHEISSLKQFLQRTESDETRERIYSWLGATDSAYDQSEVQRKRQATTGQWLVDSAEFRAWMENNNSFLWPNGPPGCGKTVLCSKAIDSVKDRCSKSPNSALAYFFFDFNDITKRRYRTMICALLKLFSSQQEDCPIPLQELFYHYSGQGQIPPDDALVACLRDMMSSLDQCWIVLDALDECVEIDRVCDILREMTQWGLTSLHIVVFSRRERDIEDFFAPLSVDHLNLSSSLIDGDIQTYVNERLKEDPKLKKWPPAVREKIAKALINGSNGMFRWVACQLDAISKCVRQAPLLKALTQLPESLDETYRRILSSIPREYYDDTLKVLQWLCFSARPLRMSEVCEILAVDPEGDPRFSPEERIQEPMGLLSLCSSLISLTPATLEETEEIVRLAHYSVKEYLVSDRLKVSNHSQYFIEQTTAHRSIAEVSLSYLLHFDDQNQTLAEDQLPDYPLVEYSAKYWASHFHTAQKSKNCALLSQLGGELLQSESVAFLTWLRIHDPETPYKRRDFRKEKGELRSPLYYASLYGLDPLVDVILDRPDETEDRTKTISSALEAAASKAHLSVVAKLVSCPEWKSFDPSNEALHKASYFGHHQIVEFLLEHGASINAEAGMFGTPIQTACATERDSSLVVDLLLRKGAEVNTNCGYFSNALQAASFLGKDKEVKMLLDAGCQVNSYGGCYGSALLAAAGVGHTMAVALLLDAGADVNARPKMRTQEELRKEAEGQCENEDDGIWCTALQAAVVGRFEKVAKLLLDHGADVNAERGQFGTALGCACGQRVGNEQLVNLILSHGPDLNMHGNVVGDPDGTALQLALYFEHTSIVETLIKRGADLDLTYCGTANALQGQVFEGVEKTTRLLLDHGADVNAASEQFSCALDAAIQGHQTGMVAMLLDFGADSSVQCEYGTILQTAIEIGDQETAVLLLSRGFTPDGVSVDPGEYEATAERLIDAASQDLSNCETSGADEEGEDGEDGEDDEDSDNEEDCNGDRDGEEGEVGNFNEASKHEGDEEEEDGKEGEKEHGEEEAQEAQEAQEERYPTGRNYASYGTDERSIFWAASFDDTKRLSYFLDSGWSTEERDEGHNKTPLHWAAECGSLEALRLLLDRRAKTSVRDYWGETPLHYAAGEGHLEAVKILIEAGADWTVRNDPIRWGLLPLHSARNRNFDEIANYLAGLRLESD